MLRVAAMLLPTLVCLSAPMGLHAAAENYSQWGYARDISLNTSATGANITADQIGFPVLINLAAQQTDVFDQAQAGGADLRFATAEGRHLAYQIELWDKTAHKAAIWVKVDTVKAGVATQKLRLYWGKAGAADSSDGKSVFPLDNGFLGVWHLGNTVEDASEGAHNGVDSGTVAAPEGRIGAARYFENPDAYVKNGKYIALGNPAAMNISGKISFEAWVKWASRDGHRIIICHGAETGSTFETVLRIGETLDYRVGTWTNNAHYATLAAPPADSNAWVHLAGVHTGTEWILYRNGVQVSQKADTNGAKPSPGAWRIGAEFANLPMTTTSAVTRYFNGWLDEVRLANTVRGADWFKLGYENQKEGQTLVVIGPTSTAIRSRENRSLRDRDGKGLRNRFGKQIRVFQTPDRPERAWDATGTQIP